MNVSLTIKNISTLLFLSLLLLVATKIPVSALLNDPIFYNDETSLFHLNQTNLSLYQSDGFAISNIQGIDYIVPQSQSISYSLYDLYLGFDNNDFTNNYISVKQQFSTNILQQNEGKNSAKFTSSDDSIVLFPSQNSILKNHSSGLQNFTISFYLYPYLIDEGTQTVAKYEGFYKDPVLGFQTIGFSIVIKNGVVHYEFKNFFSDDQNQLYSFSLKENSPLVDRKWEQHTVVIDTSSSIIKIYRNQKEEDLIMIRKSQNYTSSRLHPSPVLNTIKDIPFIIGQNSFFSLDDFSIYRDTTPIFDSYIPYKLNFFETEVFKISKNTSFLHEMGIDISNPNINVRLAYRINEQYFRPNTHRTNLAWVYIDPAKKNFPPNYSSGKFLQWRVEYLSPPSLEENNQPFFINNIIAKYKETADPGTISINYITAQDNSIEISWQSLPNELIASYEIYYGNKPNHYFGKASVSPQSPITIDVDQSAISQTLNYTLNGLENEKNYYISIRAKDIYGQYGPFSPEIKSKPSSINNPFGYSINR